MAKPTPSLNPRRPWPIPEAPWSMKQEWHDLLFIHWPIEVSALRPLIPQGLEIETFNGTAWIGVVPFRMSGIRSRFQPEIPGTSAFPELNVRTYVQAEGISGVWFFSLDAANSVAVAAARQFFHLPYFRAEISLAQAPGDGIEYRSHRTHSGAPAAEFRANYAPTGPAFQATPGTLEYFLCERYCLYAESETRIFRGEIDHAPWPLQPAEAHVEENTMAQAAGIALPETKPLLHFSRYQDVRIWGLNEVLRAL